MYFSLKKQAKEDDECNGFVAFSLPCFLAAWNERKIEYKCMNSKQKREKSGKKPRKNQMKINIQM